MPYDLGNPDLDRQLTQLVAAASENDNQDLVAELVTTALKMHRDGASRADLKLINTALKEMRYSNLVFSRHHEPKVTIYGSARVGDDDPNYAIAEEFASIMASHGWGVITGAGPGIMEAANRGAGIDSSYGVNIRLPFEDNANQYLDPEKTVNFKYFFTRKLGFVKEAHAFVMLPGGFGTLDEAFELLTLIQTGKSDLHPVVLLEADGSNFWGPIIQFIREEQLAHGLISESDMALFFHTTDPNEACDHIRHFYANYHSQRYWGGKLILRLMQGPDAELLEELNREFADIVVEGVIERTDPAVAEVDDNDALECDRITFVFNRRRFGRLRQLIDRLNDSVVTPETFQLPVPMTEEQAERPW
jgi:hypothetical protein